MTGEHLLQHWKTNRFKMHPYGHFAYYKKRGWEIITIYL